MKIISFADYVDVFLNKQICVRWNEHFSSCSFDWSGEINNGPTPMRLARAISKAAVLSRREARAYKVVECFHGGEVRFYLEPWKFSAPTDGKTIVGVFV